VALINKKGCEILGYDESEIIEKKWFDNFLPERDRERTKTTFLKLMAGNIEPVKYYENYVLTKDNKERLIAWNNSVLRNDEGKIIATLGSGEDVTERKRTEESLRKSEEKYRSILENIEDGYYEVDAAGNFTFVNDSMCQMLGYSEDELMGMNNRKYMDGENAKKIFQIFHEVYETGIATKALDWKLIKKDGSECFVETVVSLITDSNNNKVGFGGIARDVSERKQAEEMLQKEKTILSAIFENNPHGIALINKKGKYLYLNPMFTKITGYTLQDVPVGKEWFQRAYPDPEYRKMVIDAWKKDSMHEGVSGDYDFKVTCKNGQVKDIEFRTTYLEDRSISVLTDISHRKHAEEELRDSEAKYRSMMEAMRDLVYICSPDYRVEYMNSAMIKRTGRDATGENCFKALHDLNEKCPWCLHHKTQTGKHFTTDIISPKDNRFYLVSHSPIFHGDGSISKMTIFRDTTDLKEMETQLQQAQKVEAIGTLAGGIAHDFNNILFPMFGYLEMALEDVPEDNPLRGYLAEVFNGAKRARDLVKQILTFSRQTEHEKKPLKVQLVIKEVLKLIRSSLPTTIGIHQDIRNECELVMADPTQIHQVAMNLITNAYHAMEETGGKLIVTLKEVELTAEDLRDPAMIPAPHVCLTVADTGPGMDQGIIARIFDPYFTTKEEGKGTGLGLAVVHGIVKSHGGHISVYSEPGKGTEFKVYLPVIKSRETAQRTEADLPIQKGTEWILLVDDQDVIVQIEQQMLERLGYHVTTRTSSTDALEAFRKQPNKFDLVITDLTMPNMTGDKLAGELIKIRSDIPVILCTGFSEMMSKEKAAALGIKGFLMKPVVMKDLSSIIRKVLDDGIEN